MTLSPLREVLVPRRQLPLSLVVSNAECLVHSMAEPELLCSHVYQRVLSLYQFLQTLETVPVSVLDVVIEPRRHFVPGSYLWARAWSTWLVRGKRVS
ncbi:hypothetical protein DVH05_008491 [Phytophthora capsici]|nr:hypothetical protein DVH05_008491 [Phytophthora capsici]